MFTENTKDKIKVELAYIDKEISVFNLLIKKIQMIEPDDIELRSIASILHSFYNGIEKILLLILENYKEEKPKGDYYHKKLLNIISSKNQNRDFYLPEDLINNLNDYLGFRHFFRNAYGFQINYKLLKPLMNNLNKTYNDFKIVINEHMDI